jgi:hypothetical protein
MCKLRTSTRWVVVAQKEASWICLERKKLTQICQGTLLIAFSNKFTSPSRRRELIQAPRLLQDLLLGHLLDDGFFETKMS